MSGPAMREPYGIVVPVRNEAAVLPVTVPSLLAATAGDRVRILWVCNGCTDGSPALIRALAGPGAEVIDLPAPGKTAALQAGDTALGDLFPRLYLDADTRLGPGDPARLMWVLAAGEADLVAPRLAFDPAGASALSVRIGACWLALPHGRTTAFSNAIGLSAVGRALWGDWPDLIGDDIFVSATVPSHRRLIVTDALATTALPRDFRAWVRMRARWRAGEADLVRLGLSPPRPEGQRAALLAQMLRPATAPGAWAFAAARLLAGLSRPHLPGADWQPDRQAQGASNLTIRS